ncbi:hypothetical protein [Vibrio harveyi]|uniref:hypothetical protein n=1 Tax=Vibrio harveyi TaxID=669 RepID=UPI003BB6B96A|nr:hypothetical protein [Vibrio parahaemolyticus]HDM8060743.1 hypothetical protein [Vibrio harveyi]
MSNRTSVKLTVLARDSELVESLLDSTDGWEMVVEVQILDSSSTLKEYSISDVSEGELEVESLLILHRIAFDIEVDAMTDIDPFVIYNRYEGGHQYYEKFAKGCDGTVDLDKLLAAHDQGTMNLMLKEEQHKEFLRGWGSQVS